MDCRGSPTKAVILSVVVLLTVFFVGSAVVGATPGAEREPTTVETVSESALLQSGTTASEPVLLQSGTAANSSQSADLPPPHRNPAEIESGSNIQQLESLLRGSIDGNLSASLQNLDQGDYERAREQLGEDFEEDLRRYVESSDEFDAEAQAELLSSLESDQEAYIDAVEAYNTTQTEYEAARNAGEAARARELGRELTRQAERVETTSGSAVDNYRQLGEITGQSFDERIAQIEQRRTDANATATAVSAEEFTATSLSVTANRSTVGFTDAIGLTGEIRTADGSLIDSREATIQANGRQYPVDVGSDGAFEVDVQPSGVWTDTDQLAVSYRPANDSTLLGSNTTVPISVVDTETRVRLDAVSDQASYDSPIVVNGTLLTTETGAPVPATPVSIRVDGSQVATTQTATDGTFSVRSPVPTDVAAGPTTVEFYLFPSSRALTGAATETTVRIEETEPVMSVNATVVEGADAEQRLAVDGQLLSPDGRPVADEPVTVSINGDEVGELTTDSEGAFVGQFAPPDGVSAGSEAVVEATFASQESNLLMATGSTTVSLPETLLETVGLSPEDAALIGVGALVGLAGVLAGAVWWLRQTPTQQELSVDDLQSHSPAPADGVDADDLLSAAADQLEAGENETAATAAYVAARRGLRGTVDVEAAATHWEWYQACAAAGVDQLSEIETLVEAFEQVTFAPDSDENPAAASRAVSTARQLRD
jgi:hypothetical protein